MKKLFQKINTRGTRSALLGLALAVVVSMGSSLIVGAASSQPGVVKFLEQSSTLQSRIGSMAIGRANVPEWITTVGLEQNTCTHKKANTSPGAPLTTCLDVTGGATFANLLAKQTAYFNISSGKTTVGTSGGADTGAKFIVGTGTGSDGLLVSGLGYFVNGLFAPRNLTTTVAVCSTANGTMVRCTETDPDPITYSWDVGNWGACNGQTYAKCNGSYQTSNGGVCEGTWATPGSCTGGWQTTTPSSCSGTFTTYVQGEPTGVHTSDPAISCDPSVENNGSWRLNCGNPTPEQFCHLGLIRICEYEQVPVSNNCSIYNSNQAGCQGKSSCTWNAGTSTSNTCQPSTSQQGCTDQNPACDWNPEITNYCSLATNQQACDSRNAACSWNTSSTTVSCAGPTNANACTSQNPACTFAPGNPGTKTRTAVCKDSNGQTVADQICIDNVGPKPVTSTPCGPVSGD